VSLTAEDLFCEYIKAGGLQNSPVASRYDKEVRGSEKKGIFFIQKDFSWLQQKYKKNNRLFFLYISQEFSRKWNEFTYASSRHGDAPNR
jgi:hypothetical protein